jgi:hypothetical protein
MKLRLLALAVAMGWSSSAGAVPIQAGAVINLTGSDLYNATAHIVDFMNPVAIANDTLGLAPCMACASAASATGGVFDYSKAMPPASDPLPLVYNSLLEATNSGLTFSFDLAMITKVIEATSTVAINGTGTMHLTGFDATPGSFFFSTQGPGTPTVVSFSSTTVADVPEPGSLILVGSALLCSIVLATSKRGGKTS